MVAPQISFSKSRFQIVVGSVVESVLVLDPYLLRYVVAVVRSFLRLAGSLDRWMSLLLFTLNVYDS
jgi:hypothetical protein